MFLLSEQKGILRLDCSKVIDLKIQIPHNPVCWGMPCISLQVELVVFKRIRLPGRDNRHMPKH